MTSPDKDSKKIDLQAPLAEDLSIAEEARQKAGRTVNTANRLRANATFERWNAERGFGFLTMKDGRRAFCHVSELCSHLKPGRGNEPDLSATVFVDQVISEPNGYKAKKVQCTDCATPAIWELRPVGPAVFGVQEMKPVCANKPDERIPLSSPIPHGDIWEANEPFRQAQAKQIRWNGRISSSFFEEFGEPEQIRNEDDIAILVYPHGSKKVTAHEAITSGHWKTIPTGQWKKSGSNIYAEFALEAISDVRAKHLVAFMDHPIHLTSAYDMLPFQLQTEIQNTVKEAVQPAESIAEERWKTLTGEGYDRNDLDRLRQEIIALQAPGEMTHGEGSYEAQEEVTGHYGGESWGTGHYMDVTRSYWYLMTGGRKKERVGWSGKSYEGGTTFKIPKPETNQTTEEIRDGLISIKKTELQSIFNRVRNIPSIPADSRLYDITPEQWLEKYNRRVDELQKETEDAWNKEDYSILEQKETEWEEYKKLADELKQIREAANTVSNRAGRLGVDLNDAGSPNWGYIGNDGADQLKLAIDSLNAFISEAERIIREELQAGEERKLAEEIERKAEAERRREEAARQLAEVGAKEPEAGSEIDPKEIEYAVTGAALAKEAEKILGSAGALDLLDGELNASYGRGRRQQVIMSQLGDTLNGEAQRFYGYSRARDVNAVLEAALTYLQNSGPKASPAPQTQKESVPATPPPAPIKTTPASPASMADLMGKFGKKR